MLLAVIILHSNKLNPVKYITSTFIKKNTVNLQVSIYIYTFVHGDNSQSKIMILLYLKSGLHVHDIGYIDVCSGCYDFNHTTSPPFNLLPLLYFVRVTVLSAREASSQDLLVLDCSILFLPTTHPFNEQQYTL